MTKVKSETTDSKIVDELVADILRMKTSEDISAISNRHALGSMISDKFNKQYGKREMATLARRTGLSESTLYKSCQFANEFSVDDVSTLSAGPFTLSWRMVAQNMAIGRENLLKAYVDAKTVSEFRNAVTKLKGGKKVRIPGESKKDLKNTVNRLLEELKKTHDRLTTTEHELEALRSSLLPSVVMPPVYEPVNQQIMAV